MSDRVPRSLAEHLNRRPFVPFTIVMNSGDRFEIATRDAAVVSEGQLIYVVPRSSSIVYMRLNQISHFVVNDLWKFVEES